MARQGIGWRDHLTVPRLAMLGAASVCAAVLLQQVEDQHVAGGLISLCIAVVTGIAGGLHWRADRRRDAEQYALAGTGQSVASAASGRTG